MIFDLVIDTEGKKDKLYYQGSRLEILEILEILTEMNSGGSMMRK